MSDDKREPLTNPAQSETPGMSGNSMRENRETPLASGSNRPVRLEKATSYKTNMYASGESDEQVVPAKRSNKGEQSRAESVKGSCSTKGNAEETYTHRTQGRERVSQGLGGVREAARRDKKQRFTALLHHVTVGLGYFNYHAVPGNFAALQTFRREIARAWLEALRRRSQRHRLPWERFRSILDRYLPLPRILHPEPGVRFDARYPR